MRSDHFVVPCLWLHTLQPTVDDPAARDTLDIRDNLLGGTPRTGAG